MSNKYVNWDQFFKADDIAVDDAGDMLHLKFGQAISVVLTRKAARSLVAKLQAAMLSSNRAETLKDIYEAADRMRAEEF